MECLNQGFLLRCFGPCFGLIQDYNPETSVKGRSGTRRSYWLWQKKLARHLYGQFSMATAQANRENEDRCELVSGALTDVANGPRGVFVGVYDGHGGSTCSQFVLQNLFNNLKISIANQPGHAVNPAAIQDAYERTENSFVQMVRDNWHHNPGLAVLGSCCLTGLVHDNVLYVANAGDSRAVLARWQEGGPLEAVQLSVDYNASDRAIRDEVRAEHPNDEGLFKIAGGSVRVRGTIQVTRAIGDVYLKYNEFNRDPLPARFKQAQPIVRPILKAEPTVHTYPLGPDDRFVIFASDGLWDEIDNEEAVALVKDSRRTGAARRLMRQVLERAASKKELRYKAMRIIKPHERRYLHDDISVVILFLDHLEAAQPAEPALQDEAAQQAEPALQEALLAGENSVLEEAVLPAEN